MLKGCMDYKNGAAFCTGCGHFQKRMFDPHLQCERLSMIRGEGISSVRCWYPYGSIDITEEVEYV